jgi:hypothetical protein
MLPDRSKRYAGIDGDIPRLGLSSNWQLFLIALLILALLVLIFPRKALVEKLYEQETLDQLTLSYIQNLYRADTRNADVAILLAKYQQNQLDIKTLESMVLNFARQGDLRQRTEASVILFSAYEKGLATSRDPRERERYRARMSELLHQASGQDVPEPHARIYAEAAFKLQQSSLGMGFLGRINEGLSPQSLEKYAQDALGRGEHVLSSEYFFIAQVQARDMGEARRFFQAGIAALMAANLYTQAMLSIDLHLGHLENDPATLRFLIRAALAAGEPVRAARYARRLVFQMQKTVNTP